MRIIAIAGTWDAKWKKPMWRNLEEAFLEVFPGSTFVVETLWYYPWERAKMRSFTEQIHLVNDDGEDVLLLGHSMGGIIACAVAPHFVRSRVRGIVTVFSPHRLLFGVFPRMLGVDRSILRAIPIVSFATRFDRLVPYGARHKDARRHEVLRGDHLFGLFRKECARHIARVVREELERPT